MRKPKTLEAGHYLPDDFVKRAVSEIHSFDGENDLDDTDIVFGNGFIAALLFLSAKKGDPTHGMGLKDFLAYTLDAERDARGFGKSLARIFKDIDELMEAHGFSNAGIGAVM